MLKKKKLFLYPKCTTKHTERRSDKETIPSNYLLFAGLFGTRKQLIRSSRTGEFIAQFEKWGSEMNPDTFFN